MAKAKPVHSRNSSKSTRRRQAVNSMPDQELSTLAEKLRVELCEYAVLEERKQRAWLKIEPLWTKLDAKYPLQGSKVIGLVERSGAAGRQWRAASNACSRASGKVWRTMDRILLIRPETATGLAAHALAVASASWSSRHGFAFEDDVGALVFNACRIGKIAVPEPMKARLRRCAAVTRKYAAERRAGQ